MQKYVLSFITDRYIILITLQFIHLLHDFFKNIFILLKRSTTYLLNFLYTLLNAYLYIYFFMILKL